MVAFGLRLAWSWYSPARPAAPRFDDSVFYYQMARNLASGVGYLHPWSGLATAQWPPGYPFFLAGLFKLVGPSLTAAQVANAALGAAAAVLAAMLTWLLFRDRIAALLAGLFVAIAPGSVLMAGLVMSETLFTFLLVLSLVLIVVAPRLTGVRRLLALCALATVTGLAALTREAGLALVPTAAVFWLLFPGMRRPALRWTALLVAGVCLTVMPWTIRNYRILHTLIVISSSANGNFWQSHHASTNGRPDVDLVAQYGPLTRPGGEVAVNHAELREALRYAANHPWQDLASSVHNVRVLYQGDRGGLDWNDVHGLLPSMSNAHRQALGRLCDAVYYLLLVLAGLGLLQAGRKSAGARLLLPLVATWTIGHALFIAEPRYHLPLIPVFAAAAGLGCAAVIRRARVRPVLSACGSLLRVHRGPIVVAGAAVPAVAGFLLLTAGSIGSPVPEGSAAASPAAGPPPVIDARMVCSFSNPDAAAALVQGADGGASLVVGGRSYWLFGDTLFMPQSGKQIEQNAIAWSTGAHGGGCPALQYYAQNGVAVPFLPKDGSLTVWPTGAWAVDDHSFDFYTAYVYGSGPYAYWIGEVGVAHLDTWTMQTTVLARDLWDARSGFPLQVVGAQPVDLDASGRLRVVLQTQSGSQLLARVSPGQLAVAGAYEFWDGTGWSRSPAESRPLWRHDVPADPLQRLAAFENGASITYNAALHQYVALENMGIDRIGARTADRLEGPWSAPEPWLDCAAIAQPAVPVCYSPFQHPELSSADGRRLFVTFTRLASYDTVAYELTLGTAIHQYQDAGGDIAYGAAPPAEPGWRDDGVSFYAADAPLPGFVPVYRWQSGADVRYAADAPGPEFARGAASFYAPNTDANADATVRYRPVFEWHRGASLLLAPVDHAPSGYAQGAVAFYAP